MSSVYALDHFDRCQRYGRLELTPAQRRRADRKLGRAYGDRPSPRIRPELRAVTEPKGHATPRQRKPRRDG